MATVDEDRNVRCCASCGIKAEGDDIKLKNCTGCYLVSYCGIKCQKEHRSKHKRDCKKRAAELRDELLFKQPESSHLGDCPICSLPLSLDVTKLTVNECCSKRICNGCNYANHIREEEARCRKKCLFCREPLPNTEEEAEKLRMKRVEVNDPLALHRMGAVQSTREIFAVHLSIGQRPLHWEMPRRMKDWDVYIVGGDMLRRMRGKECTIWKRPLLLVIHKLDSLVDATN